MFEYSLFNSQDSLTFQKSKSSMFCMTCSKNIRANCSVHLPHCPYSCETQNVSISDGLFLLLLFTFIYALAIKKN